MIFWVISRTDFMGHFDILLFQTPQDFLETALETGAGDCFAGPGTLPGAPGRPLHLLLVDTLGEGLHHGLQLIALRVEGLLFLTSSIATPTELKAVVEAFAESVDPEEVKRSARSTWKRARACRAVAGASFEGSLQKILKGLDH